MIKYIFLGIAQGLTEFLPVSSSGHLVILQKALNLQGDQLTLAVILHLGTAFSLVVFFFKDLLMLFRNFKLLLFLFITTIITGIIGLLGKDFFESLFNSPKLVGGALLISGIILIATKKFIFGVREKPSFKDVLILGFTQSIAIIPGISRSGITISTLLFRGINRSSSFRLSFLLAIPVIFGAAVLEAKKVGFALGQNFASYSGGFIASFVTGFFSLWVLRKILDKAKFYYFGYYCIIAAIIILLFIK
ncbi:MAG: undecaprenyl-diphosphate phosphatase [Candidatus Omnitrophota bacterium]|nr:undecaprenyl-diphosphate phosphatase [Candidatus Omnitrophota bacterium]